MKSRQRQTRVRCVQISVRAIGWFERWKLIGPCTATTSRSSFNPVVANTRLNLFACLQLHLRCSYRFVIWYMSLVNSPITGVKYSQFQLWESKTQTRGEKRMSDPRVQGNQDSREYDRDESLKPSLETARVKAGLKTGMTTEFRRPAPADQPPEVNPLREAIDKLRQPQRRRQRKTLESFPWEERMRAMARAAKTMPEIGAEVPWEQMTELPKGGSYSFADDYDFDDEGPVSDAEPTGDFPWKDRQLPVKPRFRQRGPEAPEHWTGEEKRLEEAPSTRSIIIPRDVSEDEPPSVSSPTPTAQAPKGEALPAKPVERIPDKPVEKVDADLERQAQQKQIETIAKALRLQRKLLDQRSAAHKPQGDLLQPSADTLSAAALAGSLEHQAQSLPGKAIPEPVKAEDYLGAARTGMDKATGTDKAAGAKPAAAAPSFAGAPVIPEKSWEPKIPSQDVDVATPAPVQGWQTIAPAANLPASTHDVPPPKVVDAPSTPPAHSLDAPLGGASVPVPRFGPPDPLQYSRKPERAPSGPHSAMSYTQALEAAGSGDMQQPDTFSPVGAPAAERFSWSVDTDGCVSDFWTRVHAAAAIKHFRWDGTCYREYDDASRQFNAKSASPDCPRARVNPNTGAIEQEQPSGRRRSFFPDERFEERDSQNHLVYVRDNRGVGVHYRLDESGLVHLLVLSRKGKPLKEYHPPASRLLAEDCCGYEFRAYRTGHVETLVRRHDHVWQLHNGDQTKYFPPSCVLQLDVEGNRKLIQPGGIVLYQGGADGHTIMRNEIGHILETRSPGGCTTYFKRSPEGEVQQVVVLNSQGQVTEHTTRDGTGQWDSPEMDEIEVDDKTGDYMVSFLSGDEVIRNIDRSQELRNATEHYKLDADRMIEYIKPPAHFEREMRSDLAEIAKLSQNAQHIIYECIGLISDAPDSTTRLSRAQRGRLIASLTRQIAHPNTIKQGNKDTCVAANVEKTIAMNHPELYAGMVTMLAIYGEYANEDGTTLLKAQRQLDGTLASYSDSSKSRSPVSELMQTALTQLALPEGEEYRSYPSGHEPVPNGVDRSTDTGERIVKGGKTYRFAGLDREAHVRILRKLIPQDNYVGAHISTTEELDWAWRTNGFKPPMYLMVHVNSSSGAEAGIGTHAISVTHIEYSPEGQPLRVYYENPGDGDDHSYPDGCGVPIDEFVKSMQSTEKDPLSGQEKPLPLLAVVAKIL